MTAPVALYRASGESSHFSFEAYGVTEEEARVTFAALIDRHVATFDALDDWGESMKEDVNILRIESGHGYRDNWDVEL